MCHLLSRSYLFVSRVGRKWARWRTRLAESFSVLLTSPGVQASALSMFRSSGQMPPASWHREYLHLKGWGPGMGKQEALIILAWSVWGTGDFFFFFFWKQCFVFARGHAGIGRVAVWWTTLLNTWLCKVEFSKNSRGSEAETWAKLSFQGNPRCYLFWHAACSGMKYHIFIVAE